MDGIIWDMQDDLTPREVVAELDKYIIGQHAAKRAVAIALRNRYRRKLLKPELRDEVIPKNILMIGPTGVGKTEIARRLATLAHAPFVKVEATKFTEVGYVGRDVDSMVRDLVQASIRIVEQEKKDEVRNRAEARGVDRIVDILQPPVRRGKPQATTTTVNGGTGSANAGDSGNARQQAEAMANMFNQFFSGQGMPGASASVASSSASSGHASDNETVDSDSGDEEYTRKRSEQTERIRSRLREQVASGARDGEEIEIEVDESSPLPILQVFGGPNDDGSGMPGGMGDGGMGMGGNDGRGEGMKGILGSLMPKRRKKRMVTIAEARQTFADEEAEGLIDQDQVTREAVQRAEQSGIIFVDEMDKIAGGSGGSGGGRGPDVSREGVQRDILPIIEGSTVQTKYGPVRTDYMLFIAAGAFHLSKPSDLIPELQGRLPIRVELESLTESDFVRILTEPQNALITQYKELMATEGVILEFQPDAVAELARTAAQVNAQMENIGARRLHTIMERLLDELSFEAPYGELRHVTVDAAFVKERLDSIVKNEDLSRYIL